MYRIRMISRDILRNSVIPCSFPMESYIMVHMAAEAPAILHASQEGKKETERLPP